MSSPELAATVQAEFESIIERIGESLPAGAVCGLGVINEVPWEIVEG